MRIRDIALATWLLAGCGGSQTMQQPEPDPITSPDLAVVADLAQVSQPDLDPASAPDMLSPVDLAQVPARDMTPSPDLSPCGGIVCGGVCVDPMTDPHHCGICSMDCGTGTCVTGACH